MSARIELAEVDKRFANGVDAVRALSVVIAPGQFVSLLGPSGGMETRASIARELGTHPAVLLLDEPFAALDEITRQRLNDELLALWSEQAPTAVFVTHSVFEAVYLSQRVLVLSGQPGRLIADLPIALAYPRTPALRLQPQFMQHCRNVTEALECGQLATAETRP